MIVPQSVAVSFTFPTVEDAAAALASLGNPGPAPEQRGPAFDWSTAPPPIDGETLGAYIARILPMWPSVDGSPMSPLLVASGGSWSPAA